MDLTVDVVDSPTNNDKEQNGDESCILIDTNITTITIDDSIDGDDLCMQEEDEVIEESDNDEARTDGEDTKVMAIEDFQVVDEVLGSQEEEAVEDGVIKANGLTEEVAEFCAPQNIDLDVTPMPQPAATRELINIKFHNRRTYLAFQEEFIALVKNYYKGKIDDMDIVDDVSNNSIRVSEKVVKKSDGYLVDSTPNFKNLKSSADEATPTYRTSFGRSILTGESDQSKKSVTSTPRNACFNCDKDSHSLRDCPEQRNMKKINKARNDFNRRELRYHDENENEYGHMVPGTISDELRAALGLSANQIPLHVYKMRLFGYPPAWIEESKIHSSGLSLFVDKDKKQLQPGEDDGETDVNDYKYDLQKIFDFPGFNVKPEQAFIDQYRLYSTPPMLPQHSKEEMIRALGDSIVNGYKKKKMRESAIDCETEKTSLTVADMDIEENDDELTIPLGVTVVTQPPVPSPPPERPAEPMEDGELSSDSRSRSPNETELRAQRKALLAEIAESSVFADTSTINSTFNSTLNTSSATLNHSQLESTIIENSENENRDNFAKDNALSLENTRVGHVNETIFGAPVLPSFSGHHNLPQGEKFQEGVSDVIAFENLAESTGKYESMKELIKKVRVFQKDHQKE